MAWGVPGWAPGAPLPLLGPVRLCWGQSGRLAKGQEDPTNKQETEAGVCPAGTSLTLKLRARPRALANPPLQRWGLRKALQPLPHQGTNPRLGLRLWAAQASRQDPRDRAGEEAEVARCGPALGSDPRTPGICQSSSHSNTASLRQKTQKNKDPVLPAATPPLPTSPSAQT